jgi:hypothetical protein
VGAPQPFSTIGFKELAEKGRLCHADFMAYSPRRASIVFLLAAGAVVVYAAYRWKNAGPSSVLQARQIPASAPKSNQAAANLTMPSTATTATPAAKTALQLHAAFREAQRCMDERMIVRGNVSYHLHVALPPHIPGCDDMKGAQRQLHEATTAAAKAGDLDAQMCYLMQGGGDRESGFRLTDAEIAEYQSLGPQYVDAAFKRGDWRVVELLGYHIVDWAGLYITLEQWKDPLREYKSHQLLLLGAGDADSHDPDPWLRVMHVRESKDNWTLSAQEMQDSDAWAQTMYDKYFISQPRLLKEPQVCTGEDEP